MNQLAPNRASGQISVPVRICVILAVIVIPSPKIYGDTPSMVNWTVCIIIGLVLLGLASWLQIKKTRGH